MWGGSTVAGRVVKRLAALGCSLQSWGGEGLAGSRKPLPLWKPSSLSLSLFKVGTRRRWKFGSIETKNTTIDGKPREKRNLLFSSSHVNKVYLAALTLVFPFVIFFFLSLARSLSLNFSRKPAGTRAYVVASPPRSSTHLQVWLAELVPKINIYIHTPF